MVQREVNRSLHREEDEEVIGWRRGIRSRPIPRISIPLGIEIENHRNVIASLRSLGDMQRIVRNRMIGEDFDVIHHFVLNTDDKSFGNIIGFYRQN